MRRKMERSVSKSSFHSFAGIGLLTKTEPKRYAICKEELRGQRLFEGFRGTITMTLIMLPWRMWWQAILLLSIIASFILNLILLSFKYDGLVIRLVPLIFDVFFLVDIMVHFLHVFWPLLRFHIRVYRRSALLLIYDALTLFPFTILFDFVEKIPYLVLTGRLLTIGRIYRLFTFYQFVNEGLHISRKYIYMLEQFLTVSLMLHAGACAWYGLHNPVAPLTTWSKELGYPPHVTVESLSYTSYLTCWYYASCRTFNVIFGDGFPLTHSEKWLTSVMMIVGYVFIRYEFIGTMAFELVNCSVRRSVFIDRYHHMLHYLKFLGAPTQLVELAKEFKHHLWEMKDGVLTSAHLEKLPLPLQLEFIFDINVQHLHNTVIFRHQSEALLRHISLLMKHELFLPGQHVWSQGVVKTGLLCVKQGVLEMLSDEDDESPMVAFKEGTVLGEVSLFYSIPAKVTVRAATYVELQVLNRTDFMRIMVEHQGMLACSRKIIEDRLASNKKRQRAIEEYDMGDVRLLRAQYRPMKILRDRLMGLEEEDPTFVDDSHLYYRDEDNALQPKFTEDYLELYEITANVTTIDKPRICLRATFPWILEPDTDLTQVFDIIHFIVVMYICLITPFKLIQEYRSDYIKIMDTVVYTGLLLNLYTQCTTAIFKKKIRKETVKDIVEEKMSTVGFYLDLLSIFPMHIFTTTINSYNETMTDQVFLLFPLLQVWHLWNYVEKWEKNFYSNQRLLCVVKYLLIIVIFSYWSGCLLYLYACPQNLCRKNSWMTQLIHWETKVLVTLKARHEQRFFTSISFGLSVFTGSGSDIGPGSSDLVLTIMIFMFGSYLICFYFSKICSLYLLSTQRKHKFKESMRELFYFLTVNHVGSKITARVKKFFCVQWYYNSAVSTDELFENMSNKIRQEVRSIEMVGTLVNCPLFQECSLDFLQTVASSTRTIVLPDNEIVQHSGDIGRDMYILQKGHCNVINQLGNILFSIGPGASIGDVEMMFGLPKVYTILTSTNCILLYLEYISLVQSWSPFPDICDPILRVLEEQELKEVAHQFEESKQTAGRVVIKSNKITQEIKESFVLLTGLKRKQYNEEFDRLGILRHLRYIFLPGCITPHGVFLKIWCGIRFLVAIYYVLIIPYNIATKQHKHIGGYHYIDLIMYFDLIVMGYVAYYNEKNLLVTHPLLTVLRYLKGAFILDVISVMPLEQLVCIVNENTDVDLYRFNRVLLVTRITGAFSYWEDDIMQVNQAVSLLKFLPLAITIVNFMTSLIFTNSCTSFMRPGSPYMFVNCSKSVLTSAEGMYNQYAIKEYAFTFYWLFEIFVGSGCTSVLISKKLDVLFSMVLQILSVLYFALMCGHIASTRSAAAHRLLNHTEKTKDLANFLYQQNVDPALTAKTLKYFEYVWKRTHGSNPQKICRCLNSALMEDTLVFMYEHALREVPLFGKVDRSFIRVITQHLNEMYVLKGETVIQCMDVQHNVFIIYRGKVDVLNSYNEMITCMGPGGMFGNFSGQSNSCSEVTIFASRSLDLLVLPSQTFLNVIKYYPKIQEPLNKAFEVSKDYILPISMDVQPDESSSSDDSDDEVKSFDTFSDSKSASSKFDLPFFANAGQVSLHSSQSSLSQAKSTQSHAFSYRANFHPVNLIMPGSELLLGYGYFLCCIVTVNYVVILYELVTLNDCFIVFWLNGIFDVIFYMKICLEMHQYTWRKLSETVITKSLTGQELNFLKILGYINKHGELVRNAEKCRRRYLKQKFRVWSDVIANIPLECLGFCFKAPLTAMHYFRANKLLRLKYLFEFYKKTAAELTNDLTLLQRISNAAKNILTDSLLTQSPTTLSLPLIIPSEDQRTFIQILPELSAAQDVLLAAQLAMTIFVVILLIHTLSCLWLLALIATQPVSSLRSLRMHLIDEETPLNMWDYTTSLYLIVADMTATGGEELVIENGLPMLLSAAALICGKILAAIVVATSIQVANSRKHALASYEAKIGELIDMLRNQGLSNHQEEKFWQYVRQLWVSERGRQLPGLLNQTPYVRKCDLMSAMFGQHLRNSYLFSGTGEQFLRQVTAALEYTIYFPGNYIVVAGETESRMHWVESGTVAIVSVRTDLTETTHEILHDGDTFGVLQGLQRGVSHCFTYKAQSKASILTLSLDSWINFLPFFPEAQKLIRERTEVLFTRI